MIKKCKVVDKHKHVLTYSFGFTLIELIIVMAILAGLAGIGVSQFPAIQKRGRDTQRRSDIKQYQTALEIYANRTNGFYPNGSVAINSLCVTLGTSACPVDPKGLPNSYRYSSNTTIYVLWAKLEQPTIPGATEYFVVCSTGESGDTATDPSTTAPNCPI